MSHYWTIIVDAFCVHHFNVTAVMILIILSALNIVLMIMWLWISQQGSINDYDYTAS